MKTCKCRKKECEKCMARINNNVAHNKEMADLPSKTPVELVAGYAVKVGPFGVKYKRRRIS